MANTLSTAALSSLEALIRRALRYDPASRQALATLEGQVLALHFTQPSWTVFVLPQTDGLALKEHWEGDVHGRLTGPLKDFIRLAQGHQTSLAGSGIQLEGSTHLLQEFQRIARQLDIDWEEALSEQVGDVVAHQSAEWLRTGGQWLQAREAEARRLLGEFITHEAALVASRPELEDFYHAVDDVTLAVERAAARLERLRARSTAPSPSSPTQE